MTSAVVERDSAPAAQTIQRSRSRAGRPWGTGAAPEVPITYRVTPQTKMWIDLLAAALRLEKTQVVERAIEEMSAEHRDKVSGYLETLKRAVSGRDSQGLAELLAGESWPSGYGRSPQRKHD